MHKRKIPGVHKCLIVVALLLLLTACANKEDQQAIEAVESAISVINLDELDESAVEDARTAYDALPEELKTKIGNYQILTDAEAAIAQRLKETQKAEIESLRVLFDSGISECATLRDIVVQVWGEAIHSKYGDFNAALQALYSGKDYFAAGLSKELATTFKDGISLLNDNYALIEEQIKIIKDLDVDSDVYSAISDVFSEYTVFYNQVISPSGSYKSYSSDTNDTYNNILRAVTNLELQILDSFGSLAF